MASCLYECLCEAALEKYYPHFTALGFRKIDELAKVTMKDYAKLGIHNMKDRKRLFQLVKIIKILQAEDEAAEKSKQGFQTDTPDIHPQVTRSGPRRQLHFDSLPEKGDGGKDPESEACTLSSCPGNEERDDLAGAPENDSEYERPRKDTLNAPMSWTEHKWDFPALGSSSDIAPLLGDNEIPIIQRVAHISGYNYGVPRSSVRPNTSEKETPWTETDKIRVCVRKRPLGLREERRGEVNILMVEDQETLLLHEKKEAVDLTQYILQHVFYFDEVFEEACSNQDVYMKTAHPLIQHIFSGGNATCFAYGQTGAGKTYTMIGTHQNPGLYALAAKDIFRHLELPPARKDLHVWISFYEIYCGQLYDLLNGRKRLFAREDSKHVVQVVGLREVPVGTVDLLLEVILKGGKERSTGATGVNSDSSRSHAIIQIQIKDSANRVFGRISFIDLAGSERAADARDSDRQTKMEGAEINQSLLALKECIRALDQEHAHTPFRQSKLTQVLKDSFIGNSKTCMIANVSPSHVATEHTLNTLRYADRVKELKKGMKCCTAVVNRRRATGSTSPKRVQSSPCMQTGEKSSPKKVKLGSQHPATPSAFAKTKTSPLLFHPTQAPFSSTPKGQARRVRLGAPWLGHHASPLKGALRPAKKMNEDFSECSRKHSPTPDTQIRRADGQRARGLKVQPVRKQLISRMDLSLGDGQRPLAQGQGSESVFVKQCAAAWTSVPPQQKDREQHLRLYHQQFQQPPILSQKLSSQPLENVLSQYKPQEVRLKREPASPQCRDETMQLEDLEDSDFSEDSVSPGCSPREQSSPGSFFLHQREGGAEGGGGQAGQGLLFRPHEPLQQQGRSLPRAGDVVSSEERSRSPEDCSALEAPPSHERPEKPYCLQGSQMRAKDALVGLDALPCAELSLRCPRESVSCPEKATPPSSPGIPGLGSAKGFGPAEESTQGHASNTPVLEENDLCRGTLDFPSHLVAASVGSPLAMSVLNVEKPEDCPGDAPSDPGQGRALQMVATPPFSPRKQQLGESTSQCFADKPSPSASLYEVDPCRRKAVSELFTQGRSQWFPQPYRAPKVRSLLVGGTVHGCICGFSSGDAGLVDLSPYAEKDDTLMLGKLQCSEGCMTSPQYDADTEASAMTSWSCPEQFRLIEEDGSNPSTPEKPSVSSHTGSKEPQASLELGKETFKWTLPCEETGLFKNHFFQGLFTPSPCDATGQHSGIAAKGMKGTRPSRNPFQACGQPAALESPLQSKETLQSRQLVIQIRREQLDEMAALGFREESLIRQMSDLDFENFVMELDEILMLKSKCIQRMRMKLQPLFAAPVTGTAATAQRTSSP